MRWAMVRAFTMDSGKQRMVAGSLGSFGTFQGIGHDPYLH